jgi:hypothetical protein
MLRRRSTQRGRNSFARPRAVEDTMSREKRASITSTERSPSHSLSRPGSSSSRQRSNRRCVFQAMTTSQHLEGPQQNARSSIIRPEIAHWIGSAVAKTGPGWDRVHCLISLPNEGNITRWPLHRDNVGSTRSVKGIARIRDPELVKPIRQFSQPQCTENDYHSVNLTAGVKIERVSIKVPDDRFALADSVDADIKTTMLEADK